jgi:ligand-binding SRPBCC domain-containing protein
MRFSFETLIGAPPEVVFDLSLNVDVHAGSMTRSKEEPIAGVTSGMMKLGDEVTWRARHFGIVWKMTSRISEAERPARFVDEQVRGPFRSYRHKHTFSSHDGGTLMSDVIEFSAPLGLLGRMAERVVLSRYLLRLIRTRNDFIKEHAESHPGTR